MPALYTFEAKSIQNYILDSSKLKDVIGASEQIENLCTENGLLDNVLAVLKSEGKFFRRAGGEFTVRFQTQEDAQRFQSLWSYCVRQQMPGLSFIQNVQSYVNDDEIKEAIEKLKRNNEPVRNQLVADFPVAGPLVARSRRTGGPAVKRQPEETLDVVTYCKRKFRSCALLRKVDPAHQFYWPTYFVEEEGDEGLSEDYAFPLLSDNPYIGIIHADGNRLGSVVKEAMQNMLADEYRAASLNFSKALERATLEAVRTAILKILPKHATGGTELIMPARPLVVGGDDLSFIVRGDLALSFAEIFLEEFEKQTKQVFDDLKRKYSKLNLPSYLTACAGIALVKSKQPFYQAYDLAESLCRYAKNSARKYESDDKLIPSALAFHRITTSLIDDYETILERELTIKRKNDKNIVLSMQPYFLGEMGINLTPRFSNLRELANLLTNQDISRGAVRELLNLFYLDQELAKQRFERWRKNLKKHNQSLEEDIIDNLQAMTGKEHPNLPELLKEISNIKKDRTITYHSPLGDVLTLNSVQRGSDDE